MPEFYETCEELRSRALVARRGAAAQGFADREEAAALEAEAENLKGSEKASASRKAANLRKSAAEKVQAALDEADALEVKAANRECV